VEEHNQMQLNNQSRYTLICVASKNEYKKVCRLKTTRDIGFSCQLRSANISIEHEDDEVVDAQE